MIISIFGREENVGKEEIACTSNFFFSHNVFKRLLSQTGEKVSMCGNGLSPAFSPFPTMSLRDFFFRGLYQKLSLLGKVETSPFTNWQILNSLQYIIQSFNDRPEEELSLFKSIVETGENAGNYINPSFSAFPRMFSVLSKTEIISLTTFPYSLI